MIKSCLYSQTCLYLLLLMCVHWSPVLSPGQSSPHTGNSAFSQTVGWDSVSCHVTGSTVSIPKIYVVKYK